MRQIYSEFSFHGGRQGRVDQYADMGQIGVLAKERFNCGYPGRLVCFGAADWCAVRQIGGLQTCVLCGRLVCFGAKTVNSVRFTINPHPPARGGFNNVPHTVHTASLGGVKLRRALYLFVSS